MICSPKPQPVLQLVSSHRPLHPCYFQCWMISHAASAVANAMIKAVARDCRPPPTPSDNYGPGDRGGADWSSARRCSGTCRCSRGCHGCMWMRSCHIGVLQINGIGGGLGVSLRGSIPRCCFSLYAISPSYTSVVSVSLKLRCCFKSSSPPLHFRAPILLRYVSSTLSTYASCEASSLGLGRLQAPPPIQESH